MPAISGKGSSWSYPPAFIFRQKIVDAMRAHAGQDCGVFVAANGEPMLLLGQVITSFHPDLDMNHAMIAAEKAGLFDNDVTANGRCLYRKHDEWRIGNPQSDDFDGSHDGSGTTAARSICAAILKVGETSKENSQ